MNAIMGVLWEGIISAIIAIIPIIWECFFKYKRQFTKNTSWDSEICDIVISLEKCRTYTATRQVLTRLKTQIDIEGFDNDNVCRDSLIWKKIKIMEADKGGKRLNQNKEDLTNFLLYLRWYRIKQVEQRIKEIKANIISIIIMVIAGIYVVYNNMVVFEYPFNLPMAMWFMCLISYPMLLALLWTDVKQKLRWSNKILILITVLICMSWMVFVNLIWKFYDAGNTYTDFSIFISILIIFSMFINIYNKFSYSVHDEYIKMINKNMEDI